MHEAYLPAFLMPIANAFAAGPLGQFLLQTPPGDGGMRRMKNEDYSEFLICMLPAISSEIWDEDQMYLR